MQDHVHIGAGTHIGVIRTALRSHQTIAGHINVASIDVSGRKNAGTVLRPFGEVVKVPFDVTTVQESC